VTLLNAETGGSRRTAQARITQSYDHPLLPGWSFFEAVQAFLLRVDLCNGASAEFDQAFVAVSFWTISSISAWDRICVEFFAARIIACTTSGGQAKPRVVR
jgi:hypothetical protein